MDIVQFVAQAALFGFACGFGAWILTLIIGIISDATADGTSSAAVAFAWIGFVVSFLSWLAWGTP